MLMLRATVNCILATCAPKAKICQIVPEKARNADEMDSIRQIIIAADGWWEEEEDEEWVACCGNWDGNSVKQN